MNVEEVRDYLYIENDWKPEEEKRVKEENEIIKESYKSPCEACNPIYCKCMKLIHCTKCLPELCWKCKINLCTECQ